MKAIVRSGREASEELVRRVTSASTAQVNFKQVEPEFSPKTSLLEQSCQAGITSALPTWP